MIADPLTEVHVFDSELMVSVATDKDCNEENDKELLELDSLLK